MSEWPEAFSVAITAFIERIDELRGALGGTDEDQAVEVAAAAVRFQVGRVELPHIAVVHPRLGGGLRVGFTRPMVSQPDEVILEVWRAAQCPWLVLGGWGRDSAGRDGIHTFHVNTGRRSVDYSIRPYTGVVGDPWGPTEWFRSRDSKLAKRWAARNAHLN